MENVNTAAPPESEQQFQTEADDAKTEQVSSPSSPALHGGSKVYKRGPLFLSSKGIGWTSWKKRWFILTQTSLVFYRSDPNVAPQKGAEANVTLGGIDLNSSGSVAVKEDKKLITVSFANGRDVQTFTLKAETAEDLQEWKAALEEAISNAPEAAEVTEQSDVAKNDQSNAGDTSSEQSKDKQTVKSVVMGRPILLALEDSDGTPSFLEKALAFIEEHGYKTEGILRQAADVEHVESRIQEFEKGKTDFSSDEDAHVIGDCIKYILREMPSPPIPASCCKALLEAYRTHPSIRVKNMRSAICETFPEPNRRLLQRIVDMCEVVASNKTVNRMGVSAVAACMAPLLLRPLLAGECEIEHDVDVGADSSAQLLQAAAAANHAQGIVITLLEEYDKIFGDGDVTHEPYTDSEESGSESEEFTDDESYEEEDEDEYEEEDEEEEEEDEEEEEVSDSDAEGERKSSSASSKSSEKRHSKKDSKTSSSKSASPRVDDQHKSNKKLSSQPQTSPKHAGVEGDGMSLNSDPEKKPFSTSKSLGEDSAESSLVPAGSKLSKGIGTSGRKPAVWGRAPGRKNLSMESIEVSGGEEDDSETSIPNETTVKSLLQDCIEMRKHELQVRRTDLAENVSMLQELLQKETNLRTALETELKNSQPLSASSLIDEKTKAELDEISELEADVMSLKKQADDLELQLKQLRNQISKNWLDMRDELRPKPKVDRTAGRALSSPGISWSFSKSKKESNPEKHKKLDSSSSLLNIPLPQSQQDAFHSLKGFASFTRGSSSDSGSRSVSRKASTKEERRTEIANEVQNLDKGRTKSAENPRQGTGSESSQSTEKSDKHQESKGQPSEKRQDTR